MKTNTKPKYWTESFVCIAIGVGLLWLSYKVSSEHIRIIAFSGGASVASGVSRICRNISEEENQ